MDARSNMMKHDDMKTTHQNKNQNYRYQNDVTSPAPQDENTHTKMSKHSQLAIFKPWK